MGAIAGAIGKAAKGAKALGGKLAEKGSKIANNSLSAKRARGEVQTFSDKMAAASQNQKADDMAKKEDTVKSGLDPMGSGGETTPGGGAYGTPMKNAGLNPNAMTGGGSAVGSPSPDRMGMESNASALYRKKKGYNW